MNPEDEEFERILREAGMRKEALAQLKQKSDAADPRAFCGFPTGSVSTSNVGGNDVTAGETAPNNWMK